MYQWHYIVSKRVCESIVSNKNLSLKIFITPNVFSRLLLYG